MNNHKQCSRVCNSKHKQFIRGTPSLPNSAPDALASVPNLFTSPFGSVCAWSTGQKFEIELIAVQREQKTFLSCCDLLGEMHDESCPALADQLFLQDEKTDFQIENKLEQCFMDFACMFLQLGGECSGQM
ncbi:hypothetical protein EK904_001278 [Melospiza melodia maxima]|nr:hypothetical protein EK904_001278 [Melospiza melodia maxima]